MRQDKLSTVEFVALPALNTSLVSMSIDAMLPALSDIALSLGATGPNDRQRTASLSAIRSHPASSAAHSSAI